MAAEGSRALRRPHVAVFRLPRGAHRRGRGLRAVGARRPRRGADRRSRGAGVLHRAGQALRDVLLSEHVLPRVHPSVDHRCGPAPLLSPPPRPERGEAGGPDARRPLSQQAIEVRVCILRSGWPTAGASSGAGERAAGRWRRPIRLGRYAADQLRAAAELRRRPGADGLPGRHRDHWRGQVDDHRRSPGQGAGARRAAGLEPALHLPLLLRVARHRVLLACSGRVAIHLRAPQRQPPRHGAAGGARGAGDVARASASICENADRARPCEPP
mmetsp:Transcript_4455/g.12844  ORF Transcript_4455/g.12844 Transcript_4455/m.12844 type:complete len:271 (+) Transcript_4455:1367-2179(+)